VPWRDRLTAIGSAFFVLATPQVSQALHLRQLGIVVGFLILAAAWCVKKNHLLAAGAALAFATIKPQMAAFPFGVVHPLEHGKR
jgi:Glycosyltransferase family 87